MLHQDDVELVNREAGMPGLATLMDSDAFRAELVSQFPDRHIGPPECYYVRYKPATSCLAAYRVSVNSVEMDVYGKAYCGRAVEKIHKPHHDAANAPWSDEHVRTNTEQALAIHLFPYDKQLVALGRLRNDAARQRLMQRLFPGRRGLHAGRLLRLRYKPERRYVAQLVAEDESSILLKFYTAADYRRAQHNVREIRSQNTLQVAGRIGSSNRHRVLALEWLPGESLADVIRDSRLRSGDMEAVGAALAEFHAQDAVDLPGIQRRADVRSVHVAAQTIANLYPEMSQRVRELAMRMGAALSQHESLRCTVHGDFHPGQVLLSRPRVGLLDLDNLHTGDPAVDVGTMWAHLEWGAQFSQPGLRHLDNIIAALLEGYWATANRRIPRNIQLHAATALLRLAPEAFRRREPDWPVRIDRLVSRSEELFNTSNREMAISRNRSSRRVLGEIPVLDPFGAVDDAELPQLRMALDPEKVQSSVGSLPELQRRRGPVRLCAIRVIRYKPQRRCLVEYHFEGLHSGKSFALIGKTHSRGLSRRRYRIPQKLWDASFCDDSQDGIAVPRPLGAVDALQMWFQVKVTGTPVTQLPAGPQRVVLANRLAEAMNKLHRTNVRTSRKHAMEDELSILNDRISKLVELHPTWATRLVDVFAACNDLGRSLPTVPPRGIHRDFYPDQVLVSGPTLWLVDFDLFCQGDPALDAGNCCGHLIEMALRNPAQAEALMEVKNVVAQRYAELSGVPPTSIEAYTTLTLVRHIFLSTQYPKRRPYTETILMLCERRLGLEASGLYGNASQHELSLHRYDSPKNGAVNQSQHRISGSPCNVEST